MNDEGGIVLMDEQNGEGVGQSIIHVSFDIRTKSFT